MSGSWHRISGGFFCKVSWRPIKFKDPVPAELICDLCGLLNLELSKLSCGHQMCPPCETGCAERGGFVCPIDETAFEVRGNVSEPMALYRTMSELKVYCWNMENGCPYECALGLLQHHFLYECHGHVTSCPRCDAMVLRIDLPDHHRDECAGTQSLPSTPEEAGTSPQRDVVSSIEVGLHGLVEGMNQLNLRVWGATGRGETGGLEQGVHDLSQSLRGFLVDCTQSCTSNSLKSSASGTGGETDAYCMVEEHVVLTLVFHPFDSELARDLWKDYKFRLNIGGERTNVEIQILMCSSANSLCLFAKVTEPGECRVLEVEPLPSDFQCSSPSTYWIYQKIGPESEKPTYSFIEPSFSLWCTVGLPPPVPKEMIKLTSLNFLIKVLKCDAN